ncbi:MAG: hypothetical protein WD904_13030 [Dehalococcoidia bacterium]
MSDVKRIPLDRRVLVVRHERIDLRPERGAVMFPLGALLIALGLFACVVLFADSLSVTALALLLIPGLLLAPFAGMGLIYSVIGAAVVVEKAKQSVRFQQGVLGLGIGTMELVPFWKIAHIEIADFDLGEVTAGPRPPLDFRAWDIILVKENGKRLPIAQVVAGNSTGLVDEGWDRAFDAAEAIAAMTASSVVITAETELDAETAPEVAEQTT